MAELFIPNLQQFLGFTRNSGFARANRFLVEFFPPVLISGSVQGLPTTPNRENVVGMLCEEANFPAKSIFTRSLRINALTEQRAHYVDYKNKEIQFKFLTDVKWQAKLFFDRWMALAINPMEQNALRPREVGYYRDYIGEVNIYSLNPILQEAPGANAEEVLYGIKLREAWPVALDQQNMSNGAQGYHRLNVGLTFKWWETIAMNETATTDIVKRLRGEPNILLSDDRTTRPFAGFGGSGGVLG